MRHEPVAGGHAVRDHPLDPAEQLLMLELLVGEAHEGLERCLVAQPVVAGELEQLGADETLDQTEHVGVRAALDLRQQPLLRCGQAFDPVRPGQTVGQELLFVVERASLDDVALDIPANALRDFDGLRVALRGAEGGGCLHESLLWMMSVCGPGRLSSEARCAVWRANVSG